MNSTDKIISELNQPAIRSVAKTSILTQMRVFVIGGWVRDMLLGRESKDIDFVVEGSGIEVAEQVGRLLNAKVSVFKNFGTAMVKLPEGMGIQELEFVGARRESYRSDSRNPIVEDGSLEDDQNRRDFTINAMAVAITEPQGAQIIDPFNGLSDLDAGIIRTPLSPDITFSDDPLRMLRAIRFATQLNFKIESKTFRSIEANKERIRIISAERISTELNKIILSPRPSIGFKLLETTGLLKIIFPELQALKGKETRDNRSHKDNFYHTLEVLDNLSQHSDQLYLRWAALLHDIAKAPTKRYVEGLGWTFHGHEALGARMVPRIFSRFKLPMNENMRYVQKLVELHLRPIALVEDIVTDSAVRRLLFDAGNDVDDLMTLCHADITSKNEMKVVRFHRNFEYVKIKLREIEEKDRVRNWQPPIDGIEIMKTFNIEAGREVGIIKKAIREAILEGLIPNSHEEAYQLMLNEGLRLGLTVQKND